MSRTPWQILRTPSGARILVDSDGQPVANEHGDKILRCVNAHSKLVAIAMIAANSLCSCDPASGYICFACRAKDALAAARPVIEKGTTE